MQFLFENKSVHILKRCLRDLKSVSKWAILQRKKENPISNLRLPRVTKKEQTNPSTKVSKDS